MQSSVRHGHTANHLEVIPICAIYWFRLTLKSSSTLITSFLPMRTLRQPKPNPYPPPQMVVVYIFRIVAIRLNNFCGHISENSWLQVDPHFLFSVFGFESFLFSRVSSSLPPRFYLKCTLKYFIYCTTFSLCRSFQIAACFLSVPPSLSFFNLPESVFHNSELEVPSRGLAMDHTSPLSSVAGFRYDGTIVCIYGPSSTVGRRQAACVAFIVRS